MCTSANDCHPALFFPSALRDNRIQLHRSTPTELSITISNVELSDEGEYTCSIFTMPVRTARATVTVLGGSLSTHAQTHAQRTDPIYSQVSEKTKTKFLLKRNKKRKLSSGWKQRLKFFHARNKTLKGKESQLCLQQLC